MPEEIWTEIRDTVEEAVIKTIPKQKKCKKAKWLSGEALQIAEKRKDVEGKEEKERYTHLNPEFQRITRADKKALQIAEKRREVKGKGEKERYTHLNAEFQRIAGRDEKPFSNDQCKEIEKTIKWERLEISSRKLEIPRKHFMQRWAQ